MDGWKKLEALLFASGKYLSEEELVVLSKIPKNKIKKELKKLKDKYSDADTSLAIFEDVDGWKLNVKEEYTDVIKEVVSDAEMPRSVMETLAVIAYKNPVLQSEVKDIRGSSIYDHIPLLEKKGFVTREKQGRTYKIKLTSKFHDYFDIEGDSKLGELFKDVKKPDRLGKLEVYESDEDESDSKFDDKILERMKKLEKTLETHQEENNFLNDFEQKFEITRQKIDESEKDIESFKTKADEDSKEILGEESSIDKKDFKEDDDNLEEEGNKSVDFSDTENDDTSIPDLVSQIDKQIEDLTKDYSPKSDDESDVEESSEQSDELSPKNSEEDDSYSEEESSSDDAVDELDDDKRKVNDD